MLSSSIPDDAAVVENLLKLGSGRDCKNQGTLKLAIAMLKLP
jgi:hypothetical protein